MGSEMCIRDSLRTVRKTNTHTRQTTRAVDDTVTPHDRIHTETHDGVSYVCVCNNMRLRLYSGPIPMYIRGRSILTRTPPTRAHAVQDMVLRVGWL